MPMRGLPSYDRFSMRGSRIRTEANSATSGTERAKPPTVSSDSATLLTPAREMLPKVGL